MAKWMFLVVFLVGCTPEVTVTNVLPATDSAVATGGEAAVATGGEAGVDADMPDVAAVDAGIDADADTDSGVNADPPDAAVTAMDSGVDSGPAASEDAGPPPPKDAGPPPPEDVYAGVTCSNPAWAWSGEGPGMPYITSVTGCDGTPLPQFGVGWYLEAPGVTCPQDGTGYGTCTPGAVCEVVAPGPKYNTYYAGTCQ